MSAIAGLIRLDQIRPDRDTVLRMADVLTPYGAGASDFWIKGEAALVRNLLRITREDESDRQPLTDHAADMAFVFDGRLDNRKEIADMLDICSGDAVMMADSELVFRACRRWDTDALPRLLGDFALACWNPGTKRLWIARDALGMRPLFWYKQERFFAFATLPKALFAIPGVPRKVCPERLIDFMACLPIAGPQSFHKNVFRVEPGQVVTLEAEKISKRYYHRFDPDHRIRLATDDDYLEAFGELLDRAVECRLRSTGGIASHLSSGLDSSTVTATAARILAETGKELTAYTAAPRKGFKGPVPAGRHPDETDGAAALVRHFSNMNHVVIRPEASTFFDTLKSMTQGSDAPVPSPLNQMWWDAILERVKTSGANVVLSGQAGNLTISFDGNGRLAKLLGQGRWKLWHEEARALIRNEYAITWRGLLAQSFGPYIPDPGWRLIKTAMNKPPLRLEAYSPLHPRLIRDLNWKTRAKKAGGDLNQRPWADSRRMRVAFLAGVDIGPTMAAANRYELEIRDPTADRRLVEFCLGIPENQFLQGGKRKRLLKRLVKDVLPLEIMDAKTRGLQSADGLETFSHVRDMMQDALESFKANPDIRSFMDTDSIGSIIDDWPNRGQIYQEDFSKYKLKLVRAMSAGQFICYVNDTNL